MHESSQPHNAKGVVAIQLLDSVSGRPTNCWTFRGRTQITIGRSPDQNVSISDPYVSRNHAQLLCRNGQWMLISIGRHGVMVDNELITEYIVSNDICFRLGTEGPVFRFLRNAEPDELTATMTIETQPGPVFQLDQRKLQQDVGEIAEGAYFHTLQQRAIDMRRQRNSD